MSVKKQKLDKSKNKNTSSSHKEEEVLNIDNKQAKKELSFNRKGSEEMGAVVQTQEQINQRKKKKIIKIVAFSLSAVILALLITGTILVLVNANNEDSIFYDLIKIGKPSEPKNLRIQDFDQEKEFTILIRWNDVMNATGYTLECVYELYPDTVYCFDVINNGRYIERKRGELRYRVKANNKHGSSKFSDWAVFYVEPMQLELPEINYMQDGSNIIINWTSVQYKDNNVSRYVPYYEFIDASYWYGDDPDYTESQPLITNKYEYIMQTKKGSNYIGDVLVVKIRAVNYMYLPFTDVENGYTIWQIVNEPFELYDIYEVSDEWAEVEIEIQKEEDNNG